MEIGLRTHHSASLRVAEASGLPEEYRPLTREILSVQSGNQRKGHATALMYTVCAEADKWWISLLVQPRRFADGMDEAKLVKFYEKFGFIKIQDEPAVLMVRMPERPAIMVAH